MKILSFRNNGIKAFLKKNKQLLIFVGLFLLFFCVGSLYIRANGDTVSLLFEKVTNRFVGVRNGGAFLRILLSSFFTKIALVIGVFIMGLGAVGVISSPILVAGLGIYYGMYISYIYNVYSLSGIGFCALVLLPALVIYLYSIIVSAMSAMSFSSVFVKGIVNSQSLPDIHNLFKIYLGKFIVAIVLALASALLDAVMSNAFIDFFNF